MLSESIVIIFRFSGGLYSMRLGFSGMGNMASAILHVVLAENIFSPEDIFVYDSDPAKVDLCRSRGIKVSSSNVDVVGNTDILIIAVKPQVIDDVLLEIAPFAGGKCIVSIVAGVTTGHLRTLLGKEAEVIRIMPNTPLMVSAGATAIARPIGVREEVFDLVIEIFSSAGEVAIIDEALLNPVIGVNGSSPAFFFRIVEAIVKSAKNQGIAEETALLLAAKTMQGAATMLLGMEKSPSELISQVSSKGGTTVEAMAVFDKAGFDDIINDAMLRVTARAEELST